MAGFVDFVQLELPKRPFTEGDGAAGDMLIRSPNALAPRELVWVDARKMAANVLQLPASVDVLSFHAITVTSSGEAVYASNAVPAHAAQVAGVSITSALAGGEVLVAGPGFRVTHDGWSWDPGAVYVGLGGVLVQSPPDAPGSFVLQIGFALSPTELVVSIGTPVTIL